MSILRLFMKRQLPVRAVDEVMLLHEARESYPELSYADLTGEQLARLTKERGVDFATALFYDRVRRSREHGPFIRDLEAIEPDLAALPHLEGKVLVAPASFYDTFPEYGGDGLLVRQIAEQFGQRAEKLPLPSTGAVSECATRIQDVLAGEPDGSVILVSLCKGGADVRVALERRSDLARKVRAWVQINGLIRGYPLFKVWFSGPRRLWWRLILRAYLSYAHAKPDLAEELKYGPDTLLAAPATAPPGIPVINVLGFPLQSHLVGTLRSRHRQLSHLGPNDGFTLLRDAIVEPGLLYPVWGADHYFRFPGAARLLYQLFLYLARTEPPAPALEEGPQRELAPQH